MGLNESRRLVVFLKAPRPGLVKTRLAETLGADAASAVYQELVETVLGRLRDLPMVELRFTPDEAGEEIRPWLRPAWTVAPQGSGDLGARMDRAFVELEQGGADRMVVIGSDCPDILASDILAAWDALATSDVVLGPARDGGYWLIGLRRSRPELFTGMEWSTDQVLTETLSRAGRAEMKVHLLRTLADIDTAEDHRAWRANEASKRDCQ